MLVLLASAVAGDDVDVAVALLPDDAGAVAPTDAVDDAVDAAPEETDATAEAVAEVADEAEAEVEDDGAADVRVCVKDWPMMVRVYTSAGDCANVNISDPELALQSQPS